MSLASVQALLTRNARACEEARFPECKCHCGGAFHGSAHSQKWIADTAAKLHAQLERFDAEERRVFGKQLELL